MPSYFISFFAIPEDKSCMQYFIYGHIMTLYSSIIASLDLYEMHAHQRPGVASPANRSNLQNNLQSPIKC